MRISIGSDKEEPSVELTDDMLDNDNFVDIEIEDPLGTEGVVLTATVPLDELAAAVEAFLRKRKLMKDKDDQ